MRRLLGLDAPVRGARRYGQRCHLRVAPWSDFVEVHWAPHAEAYVTPVAPDLVGLALLSEGAVSRSPRCSRASRACATGWRASSGPA